MRPFPGLVNFVPALAYHLCLNLPAAFSQPGNGLIVKPCINKYSYNLFSPETFEEWHLPSSEGNQDLNLDLAKGTIR